MSALSSLVVSRPWPFVLLFLFGYLYVGLVSAEIPFPRRAGPG